MGEATHVELISRAQIEGALRSPELKRLIAAIEDGERIVSIGGLIAPPARALVVAALGHVTGRRLAVVVEANRDLEPWERDLHFWSEVLRGMGAQPEAERGSRSPVVTLPASEGDPYAGASPHVETLEQRALALWSLARDEAQIVLLTARALARRTIAPAEIITSGASLRVAEEHALELLVQRLVAAGYVREDPVGAVGEFSVRGGILDVWPPGSDAPVRIEFFGDAIDSIRQFDPETQLSTRHLSHVSLAPMRECAVTADDFRLWAEAAKERWHEARFARALRDRTVFAEEGESFPGWEWLMPLVKGTDATIFDYLKDHVLVVDEPAAIERHLTDLSATLHARYAETDQADELGLSPEELYLTAEELRARVDALPRVEFRALGRAAAQVDERFIGAAMEGQHATGPASEAAKSERVPLFLFPAAARAVEIEWPARAAKAYHGRIQMLADDLKRAPGRTWFVMPSRGVAERVAKMLAEYGIGVRMVQPEGLLTADEAASVTTGKLSSGFELPASDLVVHVERDLFDEAGDGALERQATRSKTKAKAAAFISDFRDLKVGDYVVHIDHGIARFGGLQTLEIQGRRSEFMLLIYADDAKLYVPVERLDLVQRYASAEGREPQLDRLGSLGWQKTKARARRAIRDMADQLLRLYAERRLVRGHAFSSDTPWQREFEEGFEYELTPDQEAAIVEVKRDMEQPVPMDRLLCGDVGYGKTEVAMRAAFKAVMDGKQVAVLAPTTVLAYQHFETFRARFAPFPVKIELLSRLRSPKEQREVIKRVEAGEIDILIGTHRILSKDVKFRDLGLVVIDEEQRFGVAHKERLKQLRKRVDVLTLTATPIPRTLNMSLVGLRDMSIIETPPRDRLAIQTQVVQFSESVIKSAIELELQRSGQVFFIHNRVETIDAIAALVQRLVPQARIAIAHGQMNEQQMERVMLDFVAYKYDVLVATTIIENGIDIPRANTIIINRADQYGLAQLYQLRGRVGRSNRRAYAYLLIPSEAELTPVARRRLAAIKEFSDLGAGFRIAALDLELRGAGNLLGAEQSGHMDALGFDLYMQMLERTVAELRGEAIEDEASVALNLGIDLSIPEDYIGDMGQRLRAYKRIASARDDEQLARIHAEMEDRYGRLPEQVENLFAYARLRRMAEEMGVLSIDRTIDGLAIKLSERARVAPERLIALVRERPGASFSPSGVLRINLDEGEAEQIIRTAQRLLAEIRAQQ